MDPLVTIAIPTYRRLSLLKEAVESALKQDYSKIEIIIGQDPTPQGLDKEIERWCTELSRENTAIRYFKNSKNLGLAGNWNALAMEAKGEYIMIIGDDDRLLPQCISTLLVGIRKGADVSFSNHYIIDHTGERILPLDDFTVRFNRRELKEGIVDNAEKVIWENAVSITASLIKTSLVQKFKFKEDLNTPEIELFLRINLHSAAFYFSPEYLVEYRLHTQSATAGGLKVHKLILYLMEIPVKKENEKFKIAFLQSISSVGVKNLLIEGRKTEARKLIFSKYFGLQKISTLKGLILTLMLLFPGKLNNFIVHHTK